jgi:lipoate-protein ligase A
MYLFDLGELPYQQSMLVFHTLARMNVEALVVVSPREPFVSIGYFQDLEREVDLDYCRKVNLPVFRREVGGGTVYLDRNQIFYHTIWNRDNPAFPRHIQDIYRFLSRAPIGAYREFGIETEFREVNDIVTKQGRKIAGLGGADIGDSMVFVGSMIMDFDYGAMTGAIRVPDEKFKDKIYKTIEENVTSMKREMDRLPPRQQVVDELVKSYETDLGKLRPVELTEDIINKMTELAVWFNSPEYMYRKTPRIPQGVTIRSGVEILYGMYKARGGLVRSVQEVEDNRLRDIGISGDFSLYPKGELAELESRLRNAEREKGEVETRVEEFYEDTDVQVPGVKPKDITKAVMEAK